MVNSRHVLKNNLEEELQNKIQAAQGVINSLRSSIHKIEDNSKKAKTDANMSIESIQQALANRNRELARKIDLICHTQINSLQEGIQTTLIALGSLQSTLANLDSFDHSQLLNVHIPDLSWTNSCVTPSPLEVNVSVDDLQKNITAWGSVSAKGLKGLIDVGNTASMPQRFVEYNDGKIDRELMCHKPVSCEPPSIVNFRRQPKLPENAKTINSLVDRQESDTADKWLTEINSQSSPEHDDFELVSVESTLEGFTTDEKVINSPQDEITKTLDDADSSILDDDYNFDSDLSKWLKPKQIHGKNSNEDSLSATKSTVQTHFRLGNSPLNNRFVDFPCLRVDPKYWVPRKNKSPFTCSALTAEQSENIPPTLSLPAAFWLKKYR